LSIFALALVAVSAACGETDDSPGSTVSSGEIVATSGELRVFAGDVTAYLEAAGPHARRRFAASADQRRRVVRELIKKEALYVEARRRGFHRRPEVLQHWKAIVVNAYTKSLQDAVKPEDVPEDEVEQALGKAKLTGTEEQVRAARLVFPTEQEARTAHAKLKSSANRFGDFLQLAQKQAGSAAAASQADIGYVSRASKQHSKVIVAAAFSIAGHLGVADPVQTDEGWVVLIRTGYRAPRSGTDNEALRRSTRMRLLHEHRRTAVEQEVARVAKSDDVVIEEEALDRIRPPEEKK